MSFSLNHDLHVETVDTAHLVLVPGRDEVLRLTGLEAEAFALARSGTDTVPDRLAPAMAGLVEAGIVTTDRWSRRTVLRLGGAAAAAGIATIALPGVAAAGSPTTTTPSPDSTSAPTTTIDPAPPGTLYVTDAANRRVFRVTPTGERSTVASDLDWPRAVALDGAGNLYVGVSSPGRVLEFTLSGEPSIVATGFGIAAGLALDGAGNLYIADNDNGKVLKVTPGGVPETFAAVDGADGVAVDGAGNVYVSESNACRVIKIAPDGQRTFIDFDWGYEFPFGIAVDSAGTLYVILGSGDVVSITPGGTRAVIGTGFWNPWGITVGNGDRVYLADTYQSRVVEIPPGGSPVVVFSEPGMQPNGVAVA